MRCIRLLLATGFSIVLASVAVPALAQGTKQIKGVLEKIDLTAGRLVVREGHGRKREMPMTVASDTKIATPSGTASLEALHVGDNVTVSYGPGAHGEVVKEIQVTKPASAH